MKKITPILLLGVLLTSCGQNRAKFTFTFDNTKGDVTSSLESGTYDIGTSIQLNATPKEGYKFDGYFANEKSVSTSAKYTFTLKEDTALEAKFGKKPQIPVIPEEPDKPVDPDKPVNPDKPADVPLKGIIKPGENGVEKTKYEVIPVAEYYKTFDFSLKGSALRKENASKTAPKNVIPYGTQTSHRMRYIDESIENPGKISGIYDDALFPNIWDSGNTWNKEHVWARSRMKKSAKYETAEGDLHNLRACTPSVNSSRGNDCFDNSRHSHYYYPNIAEGDYRGDIARILFYMYSQYEELDIIESPAATSNFNIGKRSVLLKWNKEDPVSEFEIQRNMKISQYQNNRNIFIDYPSLADSLFN